LALVLVVSSNCWAAIDITSPFDLTTANSIGYGTAQLGGAFIVEQIPPQGTGSGAVDAFLRMQSAANSTHTEGFNTNVSSPPLDTKGGENTHAILLNSVASAFIGSTEYRVFLLDIANPGSGELLSLNQVQLFTSDHGWTSAGGTPDGFSPANPDGVDPPVISLTGGFTEVFRLTGLSVDNEVLLNGNLNSGNGSGDMLLWVKDSIFGALNEDTTYVTLYSQFGNPPGTYEDVGSFDEWANLSAVPEELIPPEQIEDPVPLPGSLLIWGLGSMICIGSRRFRRFCQPK